MLAMNPHFFHTTNFTIDKHFTKHDNFRNKCALCVSKNMKTIGIHVNRCYILTLKSTAEPPHCGILELNMCWKQLKLDAIFHPQTPWSLVAQIPDQSRFELVTGTDW